MKQDVIIKNYWRDRDRFADLFNAALFHGESVISAEHLTEGPTEMIGKTDSTTGGFLSKYRDTMMSYSYEGIALAILGLENQDQVHYAMPLRALIYDCMNYQEQYHSLQKKHRQKRDLSKKEFLSGISREEREVLSVIASSSQFPDVAKQQLNTKGEHTMCQVFDEIFNEGKKEGHTAGLVAGKEEGSITQMIRIYLKFGTPTQTILEEMEKELHLSHKQALLLYDKYRPKVSI